jgi:AbrB family looped-hinge helix DNA binding protein
MVYAKAVYSLVLERRTMPVMVTITPKGRMSLPADIRKTMGLAGGGPVFVEETDDGVILRTAAQSVRHAQAIAKRFTVDKPEASVAAFLASRRTENGE